VFDVYRGVVGYVRVVSETDGSESPNHVDEQPRSPRNQGGGRGYPKMLVQEQLNPGDVGLFHRKIIKSTADIKSATLLPTSAIPRASRFSGFRKFHSDVFSGIYPINTGGTSKHLKTAIGKLRLNDAAFVYQPESSVALGFRLSLRISRLTPHGASFRNGSGGSTTWTSSRPVQALCMRC